MTQVIIQSDGSFLYVSTKTNMINLLLVNRLFPMFRLKNSHKKFTQDDSINSIELYFTLWKWT